MQSKDLKDLQESRALVSLAYLEAQLTENPENADRLGLFKPLIEDSLQRHLLGTRFTESDVEYWVEIDHGLPLPSHVIHAILGRCASERVLVAENHAFTFGDKPLSPSNYIHDEAKIKESQRELIGALREYAESNHIQIASDGQMRDLLYGYLRNCFSARTRQLPGEDASSIYEGYKWIHAFFEESAQSGNSYIDVATSILKGLVVYDTAFYPDFSSSSPSVKDMEVYLDSPVVCAALGMSGEQSEKYVKEALDILLDSGVHLRMFDITLNEIKRSLNRIESAWKRGDYATDPGTYEDCLKRKGATVEDVWTLNRSIETHICTKLKIRIMPLPNRIQFFVGDEAKLEERLADVDDISMSARVKHDLDCTAAIQTLREAIYADTLRKAHYIFASSSWLTIRNIKLWWNKDEGKTDIPPIIDLSDLANIAWLSQPKRYDDFQRETLVAICAAALQPSDYVWRKCKEHLDHLVQEKKFTADEAQAIIASNDLTEVLKKYDYSKSERDYSKEDYDAILGEARDSIASEVVGKLTNEHRAEIKEYASRIEQSSEALEKERQEKEEYREKIVSMANKEAGIASVAITVAVSLVLGTIVFFGFAWCIDFTLQDGSLDHASLISLALSLVAFLVTLYFGFRPTKGFRKKIKEGLNRKFLTRLGISLGG